MPNDYIYYYKKLINFNHINKIIIIMEVFMEE